ncbi:MAG: hypothetical protein LBD37_03485 [Treponema sp.]|jgi:hypothetical protein|nr:hypothetical protein [Treponema sp.]
MMMTGYYKGHAVVRVREGDTALMERLSRKLPVDQWLPEPEAHAMRGADAPPPEPEPEPPPPPPKPSKKEKNSAA